MRQFKLREGMAIGCMVTLRGDRMYEFFDRLVNVALPRVRDFRGVSTKSFDGRGNYTLGVKDQLIFPEIDYSKVEKTKGMNISITTTARTDAEGAGAAEARWECRSGSSSRRKREMTMATTAKIAKDIKLEDPPRVAAAKARKRPECQAAVPAPQPLLALRPPARVPAQVRHLPFVLPPTGAERRDSRRGEGELVGQ